MTKILVESDFYRLAHRKIFHTMVGLLATGAPVDYVLLADTLETNGELEAVGGYEYVCTLADGLPKSANAEHHARRVAEKARLRRMAEVATNLSRAAGGEFGDEDLQGYLRDLREIATPAHGAAPAPSSLEDVLDPAIGEVSYLIPPLIPSNDVTILAAEWKTAKTLIIYCLVLCACTGRPIFGTYRVDTPLRVLVVQFEMPPREDSRRFRRLALGIGVDLKTIPGLVREGRLLLYSRPPFRLVTPKDVATFHGLIADGRPSLVVVDSLLAAFAGEDLNNNSTVRGLMAQAFAPLTSEGISVLATHHKRKSQGGGKDPEKDSLLGAQAFGATAGRIYNLERLTVDQGKDGSRDFKVRMSLTGSWTPEGEQDVVLSVEDSSKEATTIRVVTEDEQIRAGGFTYKQRIGIAMDTSGAEVSSATNFASDRDERGETGMSEEATSLRGDRAVPIPCPGTDEPDPIRAQARFDRDREQRDLFAGHGPTFPPETTQVKENRS